MLSILDVVKRVKFWTETNLIGPFERVRPDHRQTIAWGSNAASSALLIWATKLEEIISIVSKKNKNNNFFFSYFFLL